jgi:hypothetical protein
VTLFRDRRVALLAAAAIVYVMAAWTVAPGFYDGFAPQSPYRWVCPPAQFQNNNQPPLTGHGTAAVASNGQVNPGTVYTQDGQASVSFIPGAFVAPADKKPVTITITPVSPCPNPPGIHVATNAYCFNSTSPLAPGQVALITLTYSDALPAPSDIYGFQDQGPWQKLGSTGTAAPFSISMRVKSLECYAGGYPSNAGSSAQGARVSGGQALPIIVAIVIVVVVLAGVPLAVLRRRGAEEEEGQAPRT